MKFRALRTLRTDAGSIRRDATGDLPDSIVRSLIDRGLAVAVDEGDKPARAPARKRKGGDAKPRGAKGSGAAKQKGS